MRQREETEQDKEKEGERTDRRDGGRRGAGGKKQREERRDTEWGEKHWEVPSLLGQSVGDSWSQACL